MRLKSIYKNDTGHRIKHQKLGNDYTCSIQLFTFFKLHLVRQAPYSVIRLSTILDAEGYQSDVGAVEWPVAPFTNMAKL